jgi:hypothetical protein
VFGRHREERTVVTHWYIGMGAAALSLVLLILPSGGTHERQEGCVGACVNIKCGSLKELDEIPRLVKYSEHLFYGVMVSAQTLPNRDCFADVTFRVKRHWKGATSGVLTVRTGDPCGAPFPFVIARDYLVSAKGKGTQEEPADLLCPFPPLDGAFALQHAFALDRWQEREDDVKPR